MSKIYVIRRKSDGKFRTPYNSFEDSQEWRLDVQPINIEVVVINVPFKNITNM